MRSTTAGVLAAVAVSLTPGLASSAAAQEAPGAAASPPPSASVKAEAAPGAKIEDVTNTEPRLEIGISPYIWLPSLTGSITAAGQKADVNATFFDILGDTETVFGLMGAIDFKYDRAVFQIDASWMYAKVEDQEAVGLASRGTLSADLKSNMTWLEFFGGYRFIDERLDRDLESTRRFYLDGIVGGRVTFLDMEDTLTASAVVTLPDGTVLNPGESRTYKPSETWFDPFVGLRMGLDFAPGWSLIVRGDVGGFDVGSDFSWQAAGLVGYRWYHKDWSMALFGGFRALGQDYTNGNFIWDVTTYGPLIGMEFAF
ncbi:MAG: hypothetical protein KF745_00170 [Phycisphaeraceae bacterium]|nr:hypothetical protein [Phycisphaeraceae bacterium]